MSPTPKRQPVCSACPRAAVFVTSTTFPGGAVKITRYCTIHKPAGAMPAYRKVA